MTKAKKTGEYRNLVLENGRWSFEVKVKAGWQKLSGLSADTSLTDAQAFAQNTANGWRNK